MKHKLIVKPIMTGHTEGEYKIAQWNCKRRAIKQEVQNKLNVLVI